MLAALILLATTQDTSFEALRPRFHAAIWNDLQLNAAIGSGNWLGSQWYDAAPEAKDGVPNLHIQDLNCTRDGKAYRCTFILFRDGGPARFYGEDVPDRIACSTTLIRNSREKGGWRVRRTLPPDGNGHLLTATQCQAAPLD
jgi:hypothetical protein